MANIQRRRQVATAGRMGRTVGRWQAHGERGIARAYMFFVQSPGQRGPGAEPLFGDQGAKPPEAESF